MYIYIYIRIVLCKAGTVCEKSDHTSTNPRWRCGGPGAGRQGVPSKSRNPDRTSSVFLGQIKGRFIFQGSWTPDPLPRSCAFVPPLGSMASVYLWNPLTDQRSTFSGAVRLPLQVHHACLHSRRRPCAVLQRWTFLADMRCGSLTTKVCRLCCYTGSYCLGMINAITFLQIIADESCGRLSGLARLREYESFIFESMA